jgi:non-specific serine/threonine protein kinase
MIPKEHAAISGGLPPACWRFGEAAFDEARWELRVRDTTVELEPRPLEILLLLLRHAGETVTREELLLAVWGHAHLSENTLSNAIAKLRRALGDESQSLIVTVHRVGYRLAVPVTRQELPRATPAPVLFRSGDPVPRREGWTLLRPLAPAFNCEVWLGQQAPDGAQRVFKFSHDGLRLSSLKREATLSRLLQGALESRGDIVRVLDWSFDQAPFFIECEYGGLSLPDWAESQGGLGQVPLPLRLRLLAQVAEAVAAAHSVGVLHKDLKPANVLVDAAAGDWRIRLTDFGSGDFADPARLAELGTLRMGFTQVQGGAGDSVSGSPLYLAPELLDGHAPTVQSDLYALGVMLYQLIVADLRRPMAPDWERSVGDELLRQDVTDAASGDPARRLASARELAERLYTLEARRQRLEAARTRQARQEALQQALDRTRARRPWLIALVLSMSLGLLLSLWFFRLSTRARDEALRQFDIAQAVNDFLDNDLMASANPNSGGSSAITVLEAVHKAADRIDTRFAASPQVALALHQTVGNTYRALGNYAAAETEFRRAQAIAVAGAAPALGADSEAALGNELLLAQTLAYENRYPEAQAILDRIEALAGQRRFDDPMIAVRLWDVRALFDHHHTDLLAAARDSDHTLQALAQLRAQHPKAYEANTQAVALTRLHIAQDFQDAGRGQEAEDIERALIGELGARRGFADPLTIRVQQQLVDNLLQEGRLDQAGALLPALVEDARQVLGGANRIFLYIVREQALVYEKQGRRPEALAAAVQAEQGYRALFGPDNDATVLAMNDSARMLAASGAADAAIAKYREAEAAAVRIQGPHSRLAQLLAYSLADTALDQGQAGQAAPLLAALDPEVLNTAAPGAAWVARLEYQRGRVQAQSGDGNAARAAFDAALRSAGEDDVLRQAITSELQRLPQGAAERIHHL